MVIPIHEIAECEQCDRSAEGFRDEEKDHQGRVYRFFICYDCYDENEELHRESEIRRRAEEDEEAEAQLAMLGQTIAQFEAGLAAR